MLNTLKEKASVFSNEISTTEEQKLQIIARWISALNITLQALGACCFLYNQKHVRLNNDRLYNLLGRPTGRTRPYVSYTVHYANT